MWLCNSSIGRKVVMSVTGIALVLFLTFHASMNVVAIFSKEGYNMICEFLGANWYAVVATLGLAALVALHFCYAIWLTLQNQKARGNNKYAVTDRPKQVSWISQNMLVLGFIVVAGMLLHLFNFWYNMMFAELAGIEPAIAPTDGYGYIVATFQNPVYTVIYLLWLAAIWMHLTHGFWSAMQTLGINGKIWFSRWKCIGSIYVTIVVALFAIVAILFACGWQACDAACCGNGSC
ncbi:MAG: succinate dehydrogenase cytochrome b subunit [Bacteroidaceae bacterium]|nr:succinate dehydrogenase cytochrome b subunit [Bacteroidaceae bacterium]